MSTEKISVELTTEQLDVLLKTNPDVEFKINSVKKKKSVAKSKYGNLINCEPDLNGKYIRFNFDNNATFVYDLATRKCYHDFFGNLSEFGISQYDSVFKEVDLTEHQGSLYLYLSSNSTGWVSRFFALYNYAFNSLYSNNRSIDSCRKKLHQLNPHHNGYSIFDSNPDQKRELMIPFIEKVAKDSRFDKWSVVKIKNCFDRFYWDTARINRVLDSWFITHGWEPCAKSFFVNYENQSTYSDEYFDGENDRNDDDDDNCLADFIRGYSVCKEKDVEHIFKYLWETYNIPLHQAYSYGDEWYKLSSYVELINEHDYDYKRLFEYLYVDLANQGIMVSSHNHYDIVSQINDYADMNKNMGITDFNKYPKSLKMAHDIAAKNYRVNQSKFLSEKFKEKIYPHLKSLEWKHGEYLVVAPESCKAIVKEGSSLSHCVAQYIGKVLDNKTTIMFLRHKIDPKQSFVTLEIQENKVVQAKGNLNRNADEFERKFIDLYNKHLQTLGEKKVLAS